MESNQIQTVSCNQYNNGKVCGFAGTWVFDQSLLRSPSDGYNKRKIMISQKFIRRNSFEIEYRRCFESLKQQSTTTNYTSPTSHHSNASSSQQRQQSILNENR
ncbi:unnamed protein product [Caenorhabditis angaria]|uniref:Uncharacterized protein n=1 Tax=Caenorhabditis angaria TaxID=860376 RepID=A0A9P1IH46_9PELO|nr:unnamed protein product [Caenorhabditis angaria]